MNATKLASVFCTTLALAACTKDQVGELGSVYLVTGDVSTAGGALEVTTEDAQLQGTKIVIPAGALAETKKITITKDDQNIVAPGSTSAGPIAVFGPDGTVFARPVTITLPYAADANPEQLAVWSKDQDGVRVIAHEQLTIDTENHRVRFQVEHFTSFQCGETPSSNNTCDESSCEEPLVLITCDEGFEVHRECQFNAAGNCVATLSCVAVEPQCSNGPSGPACPPNGYCDNGQCVVLCAVEECGLVPPTTPTYECEDGTMGGWSGNCVENDAASPSEPRCMWEIRNCTRVCEEAECGPAPTDPRCADGNPGEAACFRQIDGSCAFQIINC